MGHSQPELELAEDQDDFLTNANPEFSASRQAPFLEPYVHMTARTTPVNYSVDYSQARYNTSRPQYSDEAGQHTVSYDTAALDSADKPPHLDESVSRWTSPASSIPAPPFGPSTLHFVDSRIAQRSLIHGSFDYVHNEQPLYVATAATPREKTGEIMKIIKEDKSRSAQPKACYFCYTIRTAEFFQAVHYGSRRDGRSSGQKEDMRISHARLRRRQHGNLMAELAEPWRFWRLEGLTETDFLELEGGLQHPYAARSRATPSGTVDVMGEMIQENQMFSLRGTFCISCGARWGLFSCQDDGKIKVIRSFTDEWWWGCACDIVWCSGQQSCAGCGKRRPLRFGRGTTS